MSGATPFTRYAGGVGAITSAVMLVVSAGSWTGVMDRADAPRAFEAAGEALGIVTLIGMFAGIAIALIGLLVRHRGHWLVRAFLVLVAASFVMGFTDRGEEIGDRLLAGAVILVAYGIAQAGELPRYAAWTFGVGFLGTLTLTHPVPLGGALLVTVSGYLALTYAMWREPLAIERRRQAWLAEAAAS